MYDHLSSQSRVESSLEILSWRMKPVQQLLLWTLGVVLCTLGMNVYLHRSSSPLPPAEKSQNVMDRSIMDRGIGSGNSIVDGSRPVAVSHIYQTESEGTEEEQDEGRTNSLSPAPAYSTRVINYSLLPSSSSSSVSAYEPHDDTSYHDYIAKASATYKGLHGHHLKTVPNMTLEYYMKAISEQTVCAVKPVFMTMARVSSDLYWQLIENFFHTMYYFGNVVS